MSIYADNLREFFNHEVTDAAAAEIDALEQEIDRLTLTINRCKTVMAINDPMNYRIIFEVT